MAALIEIVIALVGLLFLWFVGAIAGYHSPDGSFTIFSLLAFLAIFALWALVFLLALLPAISIYAPKHNSRIYFGNSRFLAKWNPSKVQILGYVALSYGMTIYLFALIFQMISNHDKMAFSPALESLGTAAYFSIVTIATVGYGDILPISNWARFVVSTEILTGIAYGVFFLSVIAGFLRERDD